MKNSEAVTAGERIYKRKIFTKLLILIFIALLILLSILYLFLYIVYDGGRFTVTLDRNFSNRRSIYLTESGKSKDKTRKLTASTIDYMDNISVNWLPKDLDKDKLGSHNGDNFIAYSFYLHNYGKETIHYWYEFFIDDSIKGVDEAIRVMIYQNGQPTIYAKPSKIDGKAEKGTVKFVSDKLAVLKQRKNFKSKAKDKFTIVIWIEGDDPECRNELIGGEIKMHMDIVEEHIDQKK